jgi:hypothetical protein
MKSHPRSHQKPADLTWIGDENSLASIAKALGQRSELDDAEDPAAAFTSFFEQIPLQQLFNFSDKIDGEDRHEIT